MADASETRAAVATLLWQPILCLSRSGAAAADPMPSPEREAARVRTDAPTSGGRRFAEKPLPTPSPSSRQASRKHGRKHPRAKTVTFQRRRIQIPSVDSSLPAPSMPPPPPPVGANLKHDKKLNAGGKRRRGKSAPADFHITNRVAKMENQWEKLESDGTSLPQGFKLGKYAGKYKSLALRPPSLFEGKAAEDLSLIATGMVQHLYNEPSRGLYFCKKHMSVVTPRLLEAQDKIKDLENMVISNLDDVHASRPLVESLVRTGPKAFGKMSNQLAALCKMMEEANEDMDEGHMMDEIAAAVINPPFN